jgi:hypothetical protein
MNPATINFAIVCLASSPDSLGFPKEIRGICGLLPKSPRMKIRSHKDEY